MIDGFLIAFGAMVGILAAVFFVALVAIIIQSSLR